MAEEQWVIIFYDELRSHMSHDVIENVYALKIALFAFSAHTSDFFQRLEVSVFEAFKHFLKYPCG